MSATPTRVNPKADLGEPADRPVRPKVTPTPHVTTGRVYEDSTPFRFTKAIGMMTGRIDPSKCKVELEVIDKFSDLFRKSGYGQMLGCSFDAKFLPFDMQSLPDDIAHSSVGKFCKAMVEHDFDYDAEHADKIFRKATGAQSTADDALGGFLVAPPTMGNLIKLMRNKSALDRAGAVTVPLPPNGKMVFPRELTATTAYWVKENGQGDPSTNANFGQVTLSARKLMNVVPIPSEFLTYTNGAGEAALRQNMTTSLALAYDYAGFYGDGANGQPNGLVNYTGSGELYDYAAGTPTPAGVATDGNVVKAEDGHLMLGVIEDRNFDADEDGFAWIMRGRMFRRLATIGADAVTAGDEAGPFKTDIARALGFNPGKSWCGQRVITSSQIRNNQTKGSSGATLTEIWGGCWSRCMLGTLGVMVFEQLQGGLAEVKADQVLLRAKLFGDVAFTHPGAFAYYKLLKMAK